MIAQKWFTKWQKYTGCFKVDDDDDDDAEDEVFPSKDKSDIVLGTYPGAINETIDLKSIGASTDVLAPKEDIYGNF